MKQKDFVIIGIVIIVSVIVSIVISNKLFAVTSARQQNIQTVAVINSTLSSPSTDYFNTSSIDPSQLIPIGIVTNPSPFANTVTQ